MCQELRRYKVKLILVSLLIKIKYIICFTRQEFHIQIFMTKKFYILPIILDVNEILFFQIIIFMIIGIKMKIIH